MKLDKMYTALGRAVRDLIAEALEPLGTKMLYGRDPREYSSTPVYHVQKLGEPLPRPLCGLEGKLR